MGVSGAISASAPARANLIGNPSDQYGGADARAARVPLRARVRVEPATERGSRRRGESVAIEKEADLALCGDLFDLARAVLAATSAGRSRGPRIAYDSDVPLRSGLAGSTALLVALLRALLAWRGEEPARRTSLAERARDIERRRLGVTCGYIDHYLAVFGGCRYVDFRGKTPEAALGARTGRDRRDGATRRCPSSSPSPGSSTRRTPCTGRSARAGSRASPTSCARWSAWRSSALAGKTALLRGDLGRARRAMNENHALVRDLGGSGEPNERLIAAALAAGAPGAEARAAPATAARSSRCGRTPTRRRSSAPSAPPAPPRSTARPSPASRVAP